MSIYVVIVQIGVQLSATVLGGAVTPSTAKILWMRATASHFQQTWLVFRQWTAAGKRCSSELSMGPFSVTRSSKTHQLTALTQPNSLS